MQTKANVLELEWVVMTPNLAAVARWARKGPFGTETIGQGPLPDEPIQRGNWVYRALLDADFTMIPPRGKQRMADLQAMGITDFVIGEELPRGKPMPSLVNPKTAETVIKVAVAGIGIVTLAGIAALGVMAAAAAVAVPAVIAAPLVLDPCLVALVPTEGQPVWVSFYKWLHE